MKPNKKDLQLALDLLIERFEKNSFAYRFEKTSSIIQEDALTVEDISISYADNGAYHRTMRYFSFSIMSEEGELWRGVLGYTSLLYTNQNRKIRRDILEAETIKGVITIQHSAFTYSQIAIILFDKKDSVTWFASCKETKDAASFMIDGETEGVIIHYSDCIREENFLPEYYSEDEEAISQAFQSVNTKSLEELAEIIPGKGARSYDYCDIGIPYLRARDIQKGQIKAASVCLPVKMANTYSRQLLQQGDILLSKNFGQRKLALVNEDNLPAIASNGLFIIRPFGVSEGYLYRYLTSNTGSIVFNAQLKRIEKGSTVSAISLADLRKIKVPVYDADTMFDIEQIDALSNNESIESALRIIRKTGNKTKSNIEKEVYNDLILAGWESERLIYGQSCVKIGITRWVPDLVYKLDENTKIYIEIKDFSSIASQEWAKTIKEILFGPMKSYYVLTNGYYYEIHISGIEKSLKTLHTPRVEEVLDWERGQA